MTSRLPIMGVALVNRNFNTFIRQMGQVQRSQQLASGSMVDTAKAAQQQVVSMNQLQQSYLQSGKMAALSEQLIRKQGETQILAANYARENAAELTRIRAIEGKGAAAAKKEARAALDAIKDKQREQLIDMRQDQINARNQMANMRTVAAQSRDNARNIVRHRKEEAAATREAAATTQQYSAAMSILGAAMLAAGIPALAFTKRLIDQGAQTEKLTTAADIATRSRGYSAEAIANERKELEALYVTQQRANRTLQQFALIGLDATKASDFLAAAQDLSVGSTENLTQVYEILTQAITTGTTTRLREIGLANSSTRIMNWYAETLGKTAKELTVVEEKQAILNYILRISQGMQGAWAAQLDKTSGQLEIFNFRLTTIRDTLAAQLLPVFNQVLGAILNVLEAFQRLPQPVQKFIAVGTAVSGVILTTVGAFLLLKPAIGAVVTALGVIGSKVSVLFGIVKTLVGTGGLGGLVKLLLAIPGPIKLVAAAVTLLTAAFVTNFGGLRDLFNRTIGSFLGSIKTAFVDSIPWIRASISILIDVITWPIRAAFKWLDTQIRSITGNLAKDDWGFEFNAENFFVGAASIMGSFAAGLLYGFNQFVLTVIVDIVNFMADFLGGSLPTKGPLAHIRTSGIEIIQAWSQGMKSVSLDDLRDLAEEVEETLRQAMYKIQDALFDVQTEELQLDKVLQPFEDALFLIRASTDLITIPLKQQTREMERQVEVLEKQAKIERERAEAYLRLLEKQAEAIQKIIDSDEERLEVIDHEIFIEEQRLKIMGKATSIRLLELRGQKRLTEDNIKDNQQSLSVTEDQISAEEERLEALVTAAEAQIKALQTQIDTINASIELEEERVQLAQEALRMEEARQAAARLALLEETRFWEEEQRLASHYLDIIGRIPAAETERQKSAKAAIDDIKKDLEGLFDFAQVFEPEVDSKKFGVDIDALKKKLIDAFMAPIRAEFDRTKELISGEGGLLEGIDRIKKTFETPLELHFEILPSPAEIVEGINTAILDAVTNFNAFANTQAGAFNAYMTDRADEFNTWASDRADEFNTWADGILTDANTKGAELTAQTNEWFATQTTNLGAWVTTQVGLFVKWLEDRGRAWDEDAFERGEREGEEFAASIQRQIEHIDEWLENTNTWLLDQADIFNASMLQMNDDLNVRLEEWTVSYNTWRAEMVIWWTETKETFITKLEEMFDRIGEWFEESGIPDMIEAGKETISALVEGAVEWIEEHWDDIKEIGEDFLKGIRKGIEDNWNSFSNWVKSKMSGIIGAVLGAFGISSPAKKLIPVGEGIVAGMQLGFERQMDEWERQGLTKTAEGLIGIGEGFIGSFMRGAQEAWPGFENWLLDSIRDLSQEVRFEMGGMMNTVTMAPQASSTPTVNNYSNSTTMNISPNYARVQSAASIRDDVGMMLALRR